jgi:hypothetical protein
MFYLKSLVVSLVNEIDLGFFVFCFVLFLWRIDEAQSIDKINKLSA